jgi:hypothetical protein
MSIDPGSTNRPSCRWAVYYADQGITVTSWYVETPDGRYVLADLGDVFRLLTFAHPGRKVALVAGGIEVALALPLAAAGHNAMILLVGLFAAAGVAGGVLLDARHNPRWLRLAGVYRGAEVTLFSTRDMAEFERVRWALIRAMETNRTLSP